MTRPQMPAARGGGALVTLESPDGRERRQVPEWDADRHIKRGARMVG
jgi:hypothetical protein